MRDNTELIKEMIENNIPLGYPYDTMLELVGIENTVKIINEFGGSQVSFSMMKNVTVGYIRGKIIQEFTGYNYMELAKKYDVSNSYVRKVIYESKASKAV